MGDIREDANDTTMKEIGIPAIVTRVTRHDMMNASTMPARILIMCSMKAPRGWAVAICNSRSCLKTRQNVSFQLMKVDGGVLLLRMRQERANPISPNIKPHKIPSQQLPKQNPTSFADLQFCKDNPNEKET